MFSAILILLAMPFTLGRTRGLQFRPFLKLAFFIFLANFLILMILGAKHESPYIEFGQISTVIYFHFLIVVPLAPRIFENSLIELEWLKAAAKLQVKIFKIQNTIHNNLDCIVILSLLFCLALALLNLYIHCSFLLERDFIGYTLTGNIFDTNGRSLVNYTTTAEGPGSSAVTVGSGSSTATTGGSGSSTTTTVGSGSTTATTRGSGRTTVNTTGIMGPGFYRFPCNNF